jgi:uncharacterized protein (TIGR03643 family)
MKWRCFAITVKTAIDGGSSFVAALAPAHARQSCMAKPVPRLNPEALQHLLKLAWEDTPPYTRVMRECGVSPGALVQILRRELTPSAFKLWQSRDKQTKRPPVKSTFPFGR